MVVWAQDPILVQWVNDQLQVRFKPWEVITCAHVQGDQLLCVIVFSRFTTWGCEVTVASTSPKWCTRKFLKEAFAYPFVMCGYQRVTFITTPENQKAITACQKVGAVYEATLKKWFGDRDGLVYRMLKEECKWIDSSDGFSG